MIIEDGFKLDFKDVLIRPKRSTLRSRQNAVLNREFVFKHSDKRWAGTPIMSSNMDTVGTFEMAQALSHFGMMTVLHKFYTIEDWKNFDLVGLGVNPWYIAPSFGANDEDFDKLQKILSIKPEISIVCIDVANGYGEYLPDFIRKVRERFEELTIISGNVVTAEMTEQLILSGADVVKVGLGSGSACTTRIQTGVGYPQLSAVIECADAAHGLGGQIISDGGCTCPGDVAKAFGAGADFVMLGGMFAGHAENTTAAQANAEEVDFYGMSSETAMKKHYGEMAEYRSSEGRHVKIHYRGEVKDTVQQILGGLRSTCTYVGARRLKDLPKCTTFIRVNQQYNGIYAH